MVLALLHGTRIGITTIKGLTIIDEKPIYAFSSLEIMAFKGYKSLSNCSSNNNIYVSIMNAKASRIYYGIYEFKNNNANMITKPTAYTINELLLLLKTKYTNNDNIILVTDTYNEYIEIVNEFNKTNNTNLNLITNNIYTDSFTITDYYIYLKTKENYLKNTYDLDVEYVRTSSAERIKNGNINKES